MVIDALLDKTIEKTRVKIRYLSGRECYVMDRLLACQPAWSSMRIAWAPGTTLAVPSSR
jgi:hypothetical protein